MFDLFTIDQIRAHIHKTFDLSMLTNYAHSDWLIGEGRGLCQRLISRNIVESNIILTHSNKGLEIKY